MAFPTVASAAAGPNNSTTPPATSFSLTLPSGIVAGSLVIVAAQRYSSASDISFPAGWTEFGDIAGPGNSHRLALAYRFCDGSEGASITVTLTGTASGYSWSSFRISGHHASIPPELLGTATGTSTSPNSGSGNPSGWGTVDTLWMAFAGWVGLSNNRTGAPSSYTVITDAAIDNAGTHPNRHSSAWRNVAAASEDAGAWSITNSADWIATMVAIPPTSVDISLVDGGAIASGETFGTGSLSFSQALTGGGAIASAENFPGGGQVSSPDMIGGGAIASAEAFGVGKISTVIDLLGGTIASAEVFGGVAVANPLTNGGGIASAQQVDGGRLGFPGLAGGGNIPSAQVFGVGLVYTPVNLVNGTIPSAEVFGVGTIRVLVTSPYPPEVLPPSELRPPDDPAFEEPLRRGTARWSVPELEIFITGHPADLDTLIERRVYQYSTLEVTDPYRDSLQCKFSAPIDDINALFQSNVQHYKPYSRWTKVFYRGYLIFWGPIILPEFQFKAGTVQVNSHDPSIYWKMHHLSGDDEAISGFPVHGEGLWTLVDAANLTDSEISDDLLGPAIKKAVAQTYLLPGESERLQHFPEKGANVYETTQDVSGREDGPDWHLVPMDESHDRYNVYEPGYAAAFVARQEIGRDLTEKVIWHYGFGRTNLDDFHYSPDGPATRNRFIAQNDNQDIQVAKYIAGMRKYGILEGYERAPGDGMTEEGLAEWAKGHVMALGEPPQTFKMFPTWDQGLMGSAASTPWRYPSGYRPGDRVRVIAKKGRMFVDLLGRVISVKLTQLNAAENVQAEIECIPDEVQDINVTVDDLP